MTRKARRTEFEFALVIDGLEDDGAVLDALYERGCSDATFGWVDHVAYGEFAREAGTFPEAVISAIRDVESVAAIRVRRVEPDDLVTLSEIAERLGRSRESIRLLAGGDRGRGDFPPPVSHLRARSRLWRWADVASWARMVGPEEQQRAAFVAALNAALDLRRRRDLSDRDRKLIASVAASFGR